LNADSVSRRYLLAVGPDAERLARHPGMLLIRRLASAILAEGDRAAADDFVRSGGPCVYMFSTSDSAERAFALFDN
jgi:hypothetical protein